MLRAMPNTDTHRIFIVKLEQQLLDFTPNNLVKVPLNKNANEFDSKHSPLTLIKKGMIFSYRRGHYRERISVWKRETERPKKKPNTIK